ncbi:MAG: hypothetical protein MZW92_10350 [Comamonadaceae bacterium]|nr:hypothetical protein [Comamonadaceae bacterium]
MERVAPEDARPEGHGPARDSRRREAEAGGRGGGEAGREFGAASDGVRAALPELAALTDIEAAAYAARPVLHLLRREGADHGLHRQHRAEPDLPALPAGHGPGAGSGSAGSRSGPRAGTPGEAWQAFLGRPFRGPGGGDVPAAVRDGGRGPVPEAGGPREPEEGRRRPGRRSTISRCRRRTRRGGGRRRATSSCSSP